MACIRLLKLAVLALPFIAPAAHADTNAAGIEISFVEQGGYSYTDAESNGSLWQRIQSGYGMPELNSPYTAKHESWYASRPDYVARMVGRSQKYLYHIVQEVQKRGMPTEIALLPMVESAFNPHAYSRSHASGIWQFIPSTGRNFGLKQNWWVDNRRDITAATDAALTYLQKLHVMFGSWDLALAAYNAGEGTVMRAIKSNRAKGLPTDYQSLNLPAETKNYVPKLQAVKNIVTQPERYGLNIQPIEDKPYFARVMAPDQIDGRLAAQLAGISWDEFTALNPEYNRPVLAGSDSGEHEILLPLGADETFRQNLASYDKPLLSYQTYSAKRGESLQSIASKFGIGIAELRSINGLPAAASLKSARQLLVPRQPDEAAVQLAAADMASEDVEVEREETARPRTLEYKVRYGDSLDKIARRHGTTAKQLIALNELSSKKIRPGQILKVEPSAQLAAADTAKKVAADKKIRYTVRRGDTLHSIARKFDVATSDIKKWNKLSGSRIMPGDKLNILKSDNA